MGKPTGFLEYERTGRPSVEPEHRTEDYKEFYVPLDHDEITRQAARCMNCGIPFCQSGVSYSGTFSGCPLHNLIPEYNDEIFSGNWKQAYIRLSKTNNFPEFTGRVCPALCENACVCAINGESVTSHDNEYAIIEEAFANGWVVPHPPLVRSGKKVAIIGSGPSGLAAADCLNKRGHSVTVFERDNMPGGLLMYGIPNMKLDKSVIRRRLDVMEAEGVVFKTNADVGAAFSEAIEATQKKSASSILEEYDAVILCCGSRNARGISVPGSDAAGIVNAIDFLSDSTRFVTGQISQLQYNAADKDVVIVGGGDTGNDCVATAIREHCRSVVQLDRNPKAPENYITGSSWPLKPNVYKPGYGQEEAITLFGSDPRMFSSTVKEVLTDEENKVTGIITIQIVKSVDKETGKRKITEIAGTEQTIPCEMLILAAGFAGCEPYVAEAFGLTLTAGGTVLTGAGSASFKTETALDRTKSADLDFHPAAGKSAHNEDASVSFATSVPGVFAAGDVRRGSSLVVWAIAEGRACARQVDEYLMGYTNM